MKKHNVLASMKKEATDSDSGPSDHGRKANLDTQISGSSKWLAKAVMVSVLHMRLYVCVLYARMCLCYMRLCVCVLFFGSRPLDTRGASGSSKPLAEAVMASVLCVSAYC